MQKPTIVRQIVRWGWTLSVFLLVTFLVCVAFGLLLPAQFHMHQAWEPLLPGFEWLTWPGFIAGAVGSFLYGWYAALIFGGLFNAIANREVKL